MVGKRVKDPSLKKWQLVGLFCVELTCSALSRTEELEAGEKITYDRK